MRKEKKKRLEARGWKIGTAKNFLGLSEEDGCGTIIVWTKGMLLR